MKPIDKLPGTVPNLVMCPHCKPFVGKGYACMFEQMYVSTCDDVDVNEFCGLDDWRACGLNANNHRR